MIGKTSPYRKILLLVFLYLLIITVIPTAFSGQVTYNCNVKNPCPDPAADSGTCYYSARCLSAKNLCDYSGQDGNQPSCSDTCKSLNTVQHKSSQCTSSGWSCQNSGTTNCGSGKICDGGSCIVNGPPNASFTTDSPVSPNVDFGLNASGSSDPDGDSISYSWDLNNDGNYNDANGKTPSHSESSTGSYTIGLKVEDVHGQVDTTSETVNVQSANSPPSASLNTDSPVKTSEDFGLNASGSSDPDNDPLNYDWDLTNDGDFNDATGATPSYSKSSIGNYDVAVNVSDGNGGHDTASKTVSVENRDPTASLSGPSTRGTGESGTYDASGSSDPEGHSLSYSWSVDSGSISGSNGSESWSSTGTYTVNVTVTDGNGGSDYSYINVDVSNTNSPPNQPTLNSPSDDSVNISTSPQLNVSVSDPDGNSMTVDFYEADVNRSNISVGGSSEPAQDLNNDGEWEDVDGDGDLDTDDWDLFKNNVNNVGDDGFDFDDDGSCCDTFDSQSLFSKIGNLDGVVVSKIGSKSGISSGSSATVNWNNLDYKETYDWFVNASDGSKTNKSHIWRFETESILECQSSTAPQGSLWIDNQSFRFANGNKKCWIKGPTSVSTPLSDQGSMWVEGTALHYIGEGGGEWKYTAPKTGNTGSQHGSAWIDTYLHYIDSNGDIRVVNRSTP